MRPTHIRRAICSVQSTNSDVILIQKHPQKYTRIMLTKYLGSPWPVRLTHKMNHTQPNKEERNWKGEYKWDKDKREESGSVRTHSQGCLPGMRIHCARMMEGETEVPSGVPGVHEQVKGDIFRAGELSLSPWIMQAIKLSMVLRGEGSNIKISHQNKNSYT